MYVALFQCVTAVDLSLSLQLREAMMQQLKSQQSPEVDLLNWFGRTALELVGQGGLGYSFDPLTEDKPNAYANAVKMFVYVAKPHLLLPSV